MMINFELLMSHIRCIHCLLIYLYSNYSVLTQLGYRGSKIVFLNMVSLFGEGYIQNPFLGES